MRLGILGSTRGTVMLSLIDAIKQKQLTADIALVMSNKANALILENAKQHGLSTHFADPAQYSKEEYDKILSDKFLECKVDFIILIGYMRILSNNMIDPWRNKIINIHPSLLPAFRGGMDLNVHQAVIDAKIKETGCTIHYVTEEVDAGPILVQKKCIVLPNDTAERLKARVQALEGVALIEAINNLS